MRIHLNLCSPILVLLVLCLGIAPARCAVFAGGEASWDQPVELRFDRSGGVRSVLFFGERYDLNQKPDLERFRDSAEIWLEVADTINDQLDDARDERREELPYAEMALDELRPLLHEQGTLLIKKERRCLERSIDLAEHILESTEEPAGTRQLLFEVLDAMENNREPAMPAYVDFFSVPAVFLNYTRRGIAKGDQPAAFLEPHQTPDQGRLDPPRSRFWNPPPPIEAQNLHAGFGRDRIPDFGNRRFEYKEPKTNQGMNPGFTVEWDDEEYKIKFNESRSEPLVGRMFAAMGYYIDPADYVASVRVKYDRRIFREFNVRQSIEMEVGLFRQIRLYHTDLQAVYDPFEYFTEAVLVDGTRLDMDAFRKRLLADHSKDRAWEPAGNYQSDFESEIDYLVTIPVNFQKEDEYKSLGPWSYGRLGHQDLRPVRAAGLLAAWLGWFDSRQDNTRLRYLETEDGLIFENAFTDLGNALGRTEGLFNWLAVLPNEFPWTFTRPPVYRGPGRMTTPFRIVHFKPTEPNAAFRAMTVEDARWMARKIGRLTEDQITGALAGSGFSAAETILYREKLICRRDQMIRDLGLDSEIAMLRPDGVNRNLNFEPGWKESWTFHLHDGPALHVPVRNQRLIDGMVVEFASLPELKKISETPPAKGLPYQPALNRNQF